MTDIQKYQYESTFLLFFSAVCVFLILSIISNILISDVRIRRPSIQSIDSKVIRSLNLIFIVVACLNFIYISNLVSGGVLSYFLSLKSNAELVSVMKLSQLGYNLLYISMFISIVAYVNKDISKYHLFVVMFFFFFIFITKARVTQLVTDMLFFLLFYVRLINLKVSLKKVFFFGVVIFLSAMLIFSIRYITDMYRVGMISSVSLSNIRTIIGMILDKLLNEGNLPNYASFFAMVNSYGIFLDYREGETIIAPLFNLFPALKSFISDGVDFTPISIQFKQAFFVSEPGSGFPPSLFGEFYANGGVIFLFFGIFSLVFMSYILYHKLLRTNNSMYIYIYIYILSKIIFILPKGEMARFTNINVLFVTVPLIWFVLFLLRRKGNNDISYLQR
ncbi:oligosaccharide repeat unit polymerase [Vibrio algicola]|uniref:Oligosaccharide repeat unit polymerase n=1 Tax=Vibrio algicola TaxID=2662262 RepID=A0A5Q0TC21_9VIBR|nr:oligosaccharide repeat unit polymerase [Vibrio algicola]